jgi:hypothetical protein
MADHQGDILYGLEGGHGDKAGQAQQEGGLGIVLRDLPHQLLELGAAVGG